MKQHRTKATLVPDVNSRCLSPGASGYADCDLRFSHIESLVYHHDEVSCRIDHTDSNDALNAAERPSTILMIHFNVFVSSSFIR